MDLLTVALATGVFALLLYFAVMRCTSWPIQHFFTKLGLETPPPAIVLGNMMETFKHGLWDVQTIYFNKFKGKNAYGWYSYRTPVVVARDFDLIKDIMVKHFNSFTDRRVMIELEPPFGDNLLVLHGEHWKRVRSAVSPTFSSGRLKGMSFHVERKVHSLLRVLDRKQESNEEVELKDIMSRLTMDTIASTGFGLEIDTLDNPDNEFNTAAKRFLDPNLPLLFLNLLVPSLGKLLNKMGFSVLPEKTINFFVKVIDAALEVRKESGKAGKMNDFLDLVINAETEREEGGETEEKERGLSRNEIYGQAILFIVAGYDTVSTVLAFTLFFLANHPEYQQKVQEELDQKMPGQEDKVPNYETLQALAYLDQCISEAMRLVPPAAFLDRVCTEDEITLQDIKFNKGQAVWIPVYGLHMDPDTWDAPNEFRPERFDPEAKEARHQSSYLPFGHGNRNCIGMRLGQLELKMALAAVLKRFDVVPCQKTVYPFKLKKMAPQAVDGLWIKLERRARKS